MAYIDILAEVCWWRINLTKHDLRKIGEFTRENVSRWLHSPLDGAEDASKFEVGIYGCKDFHAVRGDIDIPWLTKQRSNNSSFVVVSSIPDFLRIS